MVVLNILCILLPSPTSCDLVAGVKTQSESLDIPNYIKSHFSNMETGNQLAANSEEFQDDSLPNNFQIKSPSYQHKFLQLHEEPGTGSVRLRYPNKLVLSHYLLSRPLRHPIAGRPAIVVDRNVFPWVSNDKDNYRQEFHPTKFPTGSPTFVPYAGAHSLTNITKFLHHVHHNLHALHGRNPYGNRENDEKLELLAEYLQLHLNM
ncbi:unnamed protein product [Orchesella dallaii]|uniref:Uncharacterized protein n=1 Tax=Orchesella dallaii TaxID=48710 RepID=A0ABP1S0A0_9HEXA